MGTESPLVRHRFSRTQYDRIVAGGGLDDVPVELLAGELIEVSPQGPLHAAVIQALTRWFSPRGDLLRVQMPIAATNDSEPEPDVALVEHHDPERHPATALLTVEVVVTQHAAARSKAAIYAQASVPEYWVVDVPARAVIVHREPSPNGYRDESIRRGADMLRPPATLEPMSVAEFFVSARLPS